MDIVLLVEDDPLIGLALEQVIRAGAGVDVVLARSVASAVEVLENGGVKFALLDINLRDGLTYDLARQLSSAGLPFAFVSGAGRTEAPDDLRSATFLTKPCRSRDVLQAISKGIAGSTAGKLCR